MPYPYKKMDEQDFAYIRFIVNYKNLHKLKNFGTKIIVFLLPFCDNC